MNAQEKRLNPDSLKNEVNFLFKNIEEIHPNMFANLGKTDFEKELKEKKKRNTNP
ncbi:MULTISPECIES: hypothetical protein [unclassified Flavobacterium]|uniref:hypothetical protein n=1 Tax=unclassified Flavobacterium TaxID=196869 RepID=UPI001ACB087A|nr:MULTISPECIES: hypothetical protein [unclassified Flavobacterium]MBN9284578.1 hypothetical protein [Flavobacterium sp.]